MFVLKPYRCLEFNEKELKIMFTYKIIGKRKYSNVSNKQAQFILIDKKKIVSILESNISKAY